MLHNIRQMQTEIMMRHGSAVPLSERVKIQNTNNTKCCYDAK